LELIVVGGGDSAIEEATFLTKFATRVHVVHRRDELRASKVMQERAMNNEKIQFHWNSEVIEINGDEKMQQAVLKNLKTNEEKTIKVGGLFVAIGHQPNTELFKNQIDLDDEGYIVLKNKTHTNMEGVFAAGDVHDRSYRQAITAAGYGCMAAIDVDKFLTENADK
jgi:thioredoxin reductase (NADPH)